MFKNFLIITLLLISYSAVFGQISLNSSGNVAIGSSPSSSYKLDVHYYSVASVHTGIYCTTTSGSGSIYNYAIQGRATTSGYTNYGIYGYASGAAYNWAGYFNGNVFTTGSYQPSDERIKKNIEQLDKRDMLTKIEQLKPVSFQFLSEAELREKGLPSLNIKAGNHIGILAQDLEKIFPEFVTDVSQPIEDDNGEIDENPEIVTIKAINFNELIVALIAAVQEQQAKIEELERKIAEINN
ncbi:MAG: tail fiber domain-containing protein [Calditrichota bacterium]